MVGRGKHPKKGCRKALMSCSSTDYPIHLLQLLLWSSSSVFDASCMYSLSSLSVNSTSANSPIVKMYFNLKVNTRRHFSVIHRHNQIGEKLESSAAHIPWSGKAGALPSCLSSRTANKRPRHSLPGATFFAFRFWWFHCWNWPLSTGLKCCLVLRSARSLWCAFWTEYVLHELSPGMSHSALGSELSVNKSITYTE